MSRPSPYIWTKAEVAALIAYGPTGETGQSLARMLERGDSNADFVSAIQKATVTNNSEADFVFSTMRVREAHGLPAQVAEFEALLSAKQAELDEMKAERDRSERRRTAVETQLASTRRELTEITAEPAGVVNAKGRNG